MENENKQVEIEEEDNAFKRAEEEVKEKQLRELQKLFDEHRFNELNTFKPSVLAENVTTFLELTNLCRDAEKVHSYYESKKKQEEEEKEEEKKKKEDEIKRVVLALCSRIFQITMNLCKKSGNCIGYFTWAYETARTIKSKLASIKPDDPNSREAFSRLKHEEENIILICDVWDNLFPNFEKEGHVLYPYLGGDYAHMIAAYQSVISVDFILKKLQELYLMMASLPEFPREEMESAAFRLDVLNKGFAMYDVEKLREKEPAFCPDVPNDAIVRPFPADLSDDIKEVFRRQHLKISANEYGDPSTKRLGTRILEADVNCIAGILVMLLADYNFSRKPEDIERRKKEEEERKKRKAEEELKKKDEEERKKKEKEEEEKKNPEYAKIAIEKKLQEKKKSRSKKAIRVKEEMAKLVKNNPPADPKTEKQVEIEPLSKDVKKLTIVEMVQLATDAILKKRDEENIPEDKIDTNMILTQLCMIYSENAHRLHFANELTSKIEKLNGEVFGKEEEEEEPKEEPKEENEEFEEELEESEEEEEPEKEKK